MVAATDPKSTFDLSASSSPRVFFLLSVRRGPLSAPLDHVGAAAKLDT